MHVGYGAAFQNRGEDPDDVFMRRELALCLRAEELGFDSVWLPEHHFSDYGLVPDPLQILAFVAARSSTIKLGTGVLVLPWHDPVRIAEKVILLDHLSEGRVLVGLGRGLSKYEFQGLRVPQEESRARFNEYARLVLDALETGVIEGGELTRQPRRELRPRPSRSFAGRVFSASVSPESAPISAELGLGAMFLIVKPLEALQADWLRYQDAWRAIHGDAEPPRPFLQAAVVVDESADRAAEVASRHGNASHRVAVRHYGMADDDFGTAKGYDYYQVMRTTVDGDAPPGAQERPPATIVHGTPDQVLEQLDAYRQALDLQGVYAIFHGVPEEDGRRNVECFVERCLPELKSWGTEHMAGKEAAL
ncbi:MAG TPA: LLM class flavin-dependent oxidoreductase [Solirubrobacteraceae bacterium]|jgi:alkanesulfonate monooxygenase SsuD/methylene tetrahydromethanopterin reductase-like flavin-dependent oxidoreductase (luciferase family)|nr:LLM class flavin-dependent oxidoreductase [Solirubrobacteraceae bacterium]